MKENAVQGGFLRFGSALASQLIFKFRAVLQPWVYWLKKSHSTPQSYIGKWQIQETDLAANPEVLAELPAHTRDIYTNKVRQEQCETTL